jgi:hypothetical protein
LNTYSASIVLGAFGKRSNLDIKLKRSFIQKQSHWLGVKAHYKLDFPEDYVGLHHLKEDIVVFLRYNKNICYLANYETFKQHKSIEDYQKMWFVKIETSRILKCCNSI